MKFTECDNGCALRTIGLAWIYRGKFTLCNLTLILPTFQNYKIYQGGAESAPPPTISKSSSLIKKNLSKHFNHK